MHWTLRRSDAPPADPATLAQTASRLQISELLAGLLWRRGHLGIEEMDLYLSPGLRHLAQPDQWPGIADGARILAQALEDGLTLAVWGDYDVDGVTSTALVADFLRKRGYAPITRLPRRMEEGYGLNVSGIEELAAAGAGVLLTVDCGIQDIAAITRAKELGLRVVISDHHLPGDELPPADAICDPRLVAAADCPCADLAGVGVAFFLMAALNRLLPGTPLDMRQFLDLVAMGTLADVVPLQGQNRILVKNGLLLITEASRPGIAALKEVSGFNIKGALGAGQVVFSLAPRINAVGRLDDAAKALEMLLSPDIETARPLAAALDACNTARRDEEERILEQAKEQAGEQQERLGLVLYSPEWHQGVIGIVASRIVELTYKPAILLCRYENGDGSTLLKGSGRSIPEFDLYAGLTACADTLAGYGGHRQAAGLRLTEDNLSPLRERFHQAVIEQLGETPLQAKQSVDAELGFGSIDYTLLKEIELMQPFGMGNPEPVFISPPVDVLGRRVFAEKHVNLTLRDGYANIIMKGKAWRQAETIPEDLKGKRVRVAFTPKLDNYRGTPSIDLHVRSLFIEE